MTPFELGPLHSPGHFLPLPAQPSRPPIATLPLHMSRSWPPHPLPRQVSTCVWWLASRAQLDLFMAVGPGENCRKQIQNQTFPRFAIRPKY